MDVRNGIYLCKRLENKPDLYWTALKGKGIVFPLDFTDMHF